MIRYLTFGLAAQRKKSKASRSRSSTAEIDTKPVIPDSEGEDEIGECIVVNPIPDVQACDLAPAARGEKSGLFSASRWISALPGIGTLFSPNRTAFNPITEVPPVHPHSGVQPLSQSESPDNASSKKRKSTATLKRSYSEPQFAYTGPLVTRSGRTRSQHVAPTLSQSKRQKLSQTKSVPVVVIDSDDDEEDPLLLSPASARKHDTEEKAKLEEKARLARESQDC